MTFGKRLMNSLIKVAKYARNFGFSAIIDISVFAVVLFFTKPVFGKGLAIVIASITARILSSLVNFSLNRSLFKGKDTNHDGSLARYYILWLTLLTLTSSFTYLLNDIFKFNEVLAKVISDVSLGLFSYQTQLKWVFSDKSKLIKKGLYFRITRKLLSLYFKYEIIIDEEIFMTENVLVGHHQNFYGPISTLVYLPDSVNIWVVSHLFNFKESFNMFYNFTFAKTIKLPRIIALIFSTFCALLIPPLLRSARAIPVYREASNIMKTFNRSMELLNKGKQILVYPDIDYNDKSEIMGEIHNGFLHLEKLYYRANKTHLGFVPIHVNKTAGIITNSKTLYFSDDKPYDIERDLLVNEIIANINMKYS